MTQWTELGKFTLGTGAVDALWLLALETVTGHTHLRFSATGSWTFLPGSGLSCGPDGGAGLSLAPAAFLVSDCLPGCLIGRLGGSSASILGAPPSIAAQSTAETTQAPAPAPAGLFPIGSECLYKVPDGVHGPLFVGFNVRSRPITVQALELKIGGGTLP